MPRWGPAIKFLWPQRLRKVMTITHSKLKALRFLHEHNITHRDICNDNFLVNHCCDNFDRIFDFDHAIKLPSGVDRTQYRFPYHKSWGTINVITDTCQGEYDFNPFVFDVSALGVSFCHSYQYLAPLVPMFAPFFDRLIIRNLARFIASETLSFFEDIISQLSEEELDHQIELGDYAQPTPYDVFDWWAYVTPEFLNKWAHYREPLAIPWTTTLLRKVYPGVAILYPVLVVLCLKYSLSFVISNPESKES